MSNRVVYGLSFSENGWPMVDEGSCNWITVPGTNPPVSLEIQQGWPTAILRAWAADHNAYVEPLRDADSACWTATNSVASSNHLSGTAADLDWQNHPFQVSYAGFNDAQIATIREMLDFYEQKVFWGEDWGLQGIGPFDAMHVQLNGDTYNNPATGDFITRKIRADGFSTFRRGSAPVTPPAAQVLADATGLDLGRATEILPTVISGLQASECANVNRIAMWLAQCGEESAGFSTTEEFASGAEYEARADLGNTQPGDGVRFKGRTWIQITGRAHYQEFSQWAFGKGLTSSATQFVDNPTSLGDLPWAGIGAAWYWTVSRPDINALSDAGDVVTVTHRINGGENGLADRQSRYDRAHALGDQLLALATGAPPAPPTLPGDDMALVPQEQWDAFYHAYMDDLPSLSPLRKLGEGNVGPLHKFVRWMDANTHVPVMKLLAGLGHPATLRDLRELAAADLSRYPDRAEGRDMAQAILADVTSKPQAVVQQAAQELQIPAPVAPQVVYVDRPVAAAPVALPAPVTDKSMGDVVKTIVDAVEQLKLADALTIQDRATLAASIKILEMKNGASI